MTDAGPIDHFSALHFFAYSFSSHYSRVAVCPVEAFREGENLAFIDSDACNCCDAYVLECPVEEIFAEGDVLGNGMILSP